MKKISFLPGLALIGLFVFSNFSTNAGNANFVEEFVSNNAVSDEGASGAYSFNKPHSTIGFRVKHMGLVDVPGYFRDFSGIINYDAKDVSKSTIEFSAKTTSVDTGVAPRDTHLRTADFFDVEKFPDMTFKSAKIEKKNKQWMMTGDLTMRGVTKQVTFPFELVGFAKDQKGGVTMGATAETTINRRDFGVNYGGNLPNGTPVLSDEIKVVLQIEANFIPPLPSAATK